MISVPLEMYFAPVDETDIQEIAADISEEVSLARFLQKKQVRTECSQGAITRLIQCPIPACHQSIPEENYPTHLYVHHRFGY